MPSITGIQTNVTAGEISPRLYGRIDLEKYRSAAYEITNFVVQRFGGVRKRGGFQYIGEVKSSSTKVRLVSFIYSVTQAYIIEFGDEYVRFYTNGGQVQSGGSAVEVSTPWDEDEIWELQFAQSADVLYIVHPDYAPRTLSRTSATSFSLDTLDFEDGPYLDINTTGTSLTPASYGSIVPTMTSNTTPSGTAADDGGGSAYLAFARNDAATSPFTRAALSGWISYAPTSSKVVDGYSLKANANFPDRMVTSWKVQGYDGSSWVTLDSQSGETGWAGGEWRTYEFVNETAYQSYRLSWTATDSTVASTYIQRLDFHERAENQTAFNLTASAVTGINDGDGFQTTDVGRRIRLLGSDGIWRWAEVIARSSTTVVTIQLHGAALPDLDPIVNWRIGAWNDETGWPGSVSFYEGRLCFARTAEQPETVWMSRVDDFVDHGVSDPVADDDAVDVTIRSESLNEVKWIAESADLFVGTSAAIRVIGPATNSEPFSPTNVKQRRETTFGAKSVQPVLVGNVGLYADYYGSALREFSYSFELNGYVSQDVSILAEHMLAGGIKEMAFAQNPDSVLWIVKEDGTLCGVTYERDQNVIAFHEHEIGGTGVTVESVATIPGSDRDEVWFVVKRTIDGSDVRYIERLSVGLDDSDDKDEATFLDSYLAYSGSSATTLTGLDHLEGENVYVWGDAGKQGPYTVSSGEITIDDAVTTACVGLSYTSTWQPLSPEAGAKGGTAQTRLGVTPEVTLRLDRSMDGSVGASEGVLEDLDYTASMDHEAAYGTGAGLYTGDVRVPIADAWDRYKRLKIQHSDPTPFHCIALIFDHRVTG